MKKFSSKSSVNDLQRTQTLHSFVITVLSVAVIVLVSVVAVLLAQASDHRDSIDALYSAVNKLSTEE